jgi:hypothetical protein
VSLLAYTASTWTQVIVGLSIFVPVVITAALCWVILRGKTNDPDAQRLKQAQADYEARQAEQGSRRR